MTISRDESILFQVAFKEANKNLRYSGTCYDKDYYNNLLKMSLKIYEDVLVKGLNEIELRKSAVLGLDKHIADIKNIKTIEEFKLYQNKFAVELSNLSRDDKAKLKEFCQLHFKK